MLSPRYAAVFKMDESDTYAQEVRIVSRLSDEQRDLYNELTILQQSICLNKLDGMTWREAYESSPFVMALYSKSAISSIQNKAPVQAFLKSIYSDEVDKRIMSRDEALMILTRQARGKQSDVVNFTSHFVGMCPNGGGPIWKTEFGLKHVSEIDDELFANIIEIAHTKEGIKVKRESARGAIRDLSSMQGWDSASKHEVTGPGGGPLEGCMLDKDEYANVRKEMLDHDDC